jgi:hypothetical protein
LIEERQEAEGRRQKEEKGTNLARHLLRRGYEPRPQWLPLWAKKLKTFFARCVALLKDTSLSKLLPFMGEVSLLPPARTAFCLAAKGGFDINNSKLLLGG